jgi:benzoyl-CoA reductase/2-hydroxyglutaryl-CoA dehydratase subunit BcrC/BadD/HgdB
MNIKTDQAEKIFTQPSQPVLEKSVLYTCSYIPQEIIEAAGLYAYRIEANTDLKTNDSYFPTNFCPYIKNTANYLLDKKDEIKALVLATSCDGMRRLFDITQSYMPKINLFMLDVPRIVHDESIAFYSHNLEEMASFLDHIGIGQKITFESLKNAVKIIGEKNRLLQDLKESYMHSEGGVRLHDYYHAWKASMRMDTVSFNAMLKKTLSQIKRPAAEDLKKKKNIMVMGNYINDERLWEILSGLDVQVSMDDICFSHRNIVNGIKSDEAKNKEDLLLSIAGSYLNKPACFRMANLDNKILQTKAYLNEKNIDALIYISLKFCDTTLYFYPFLKEELKSMKVPSLFLEIEHGKLSVGQVRTRIEAFLEMI